MIEAQQGQQRGMEVIDVHAAFDGAHAEFISGPKRKSLLDAAAGEPHRVAGDIVIPAVLPLRRGLAPELAAEQDERLLEQTSVIQISQQGGQVG